MYQNSMCTLNGTTSRPSMRLLYKANVYTSWAHGQLGDVLQRRSARHCPKGRPWTLRRRLRARECSLFLHSDLFMFALIVYAGVLTYCYNIASSDYQQYCVLLSFVVVVILVVVSRRRRRRGVVVSSLILAAVVVLISV